MLTRRSRIPPGLRGADQPLLILMMAVAVDKRVRKNVDQPEKRY